MALFEREDPEFGSDVATRALSVTAVESDFVERVYERLASVYDLTFGPTLHPGRLQARDRMRRMGEFALGTDLPYEAMTSLSFDASATRIAWSCT